MPRPEGERPGDAESRTASESKGARDAEAQSTSLTRIRQPTEIVDQRGKGVVLVVDGDQERGEVTADGLEAAGFRCDIADHGDAALEALEKNRYELVLADLELEGTSGTEFLCRVREINPHAGLIVLTSHESMADATAAAVEAGRLGVSEYLVRPPDFDDLVEKAMRTVEKSRLGELARDRAKSIPRGAPPGFERIIYASESMRRVVERCSQVASKDVTVLITGESGTGKDLLAHAIHQASPRRSRRFMPVNCAALSPQIIESELFGHEKGAFTGAISSRLGYFEHSNRGTIFLDEVGDIPLETQVKLLRVLENREIVRVGANDPVPVDVRVVAATHRNLEERVAEGKFREDLYYRLKVVPIHLPPLRERRDDIPLLVYHFVAKYADAYDKHFEEVEPAAVAALATHSWKGNVRELRHVIENIIVVAPGPLITVADLPESIRIARPQLEGGTAPSLDGLVGRTIQDVEREHIRNTLASVDGNRQEAAKMLGIAERTLYRRIKEYGL